MAALRPPVSDPSSVFNRFRDRQQREEQFSQDIKMVIGGGGDCRFGRGDGCSGSGAGSGRAAGATRTRSPGLAAGAALALGGIGACAGTSSAEVAKAEADTKRRQIVEHSRRQTVGRDCPFDDHAAFGAGAEAALPPRPQRLGAPPADEARMARDAAAALEKQNRERQTRIGAPAPFDAPERGRLGADIPAAPQREEGVGARSTVRSGANAAQEAAFGEARAESLRIKSRMVRGTEDLISGNYAPFDGGAGHAPRGQGQRGSSLPPPAKALLLPQADFKVQYAGADPTTITRERAEYLNSQVLAEGNRSRNESLTLKLH